MMIAKTLLLCASIFLPTQVMAQMLTISEDEFGLPRAGVNQARVSSYARDMTGIEPARDFPSGPIREVANAVGLLHVMQAGFDENGNRLTGACTATLVSKDIILTNSHCVEQQGANRPLKIEWILGYESPELRASAPRIRVYLDPLEVDGRLDYALLRLAEDVRGVSPVNLVPRDPAANERLYIVGHPLGIEKHVSLGLCRAFSTPLNGIDVNHKCNTYEGNSGSLIISDIDRRSVVGLHKSGGREVNKGTRMTALLRESRILAEIAGLERLPEPEIPPVAAGPLAHIRACDAAAAIPGNPDNPPGVPGLPWARLHATDAIAICQAALEITPRHPRLMFQLGRAYHKAGKYDLAVAQYDSGAREGYAASLNNLARLYIDGEGVRQDVGYGISLYERAIREGYGLAARNLGNMYRDADGVARDNAKAMAMYRKSFSLGDMEAAADIGWMYDKGLGVEKNHVEAVKWYGLAAKEDIAWALNNLGATQLWDDTAVRDHAAGRRNIERAYRLGYVKFAAHNLGRIYEEGLGVQVDYGRAEEFFQESLIAGNSYAQIRLGDLWRDRKDGAVDYERARAYYQSGWDAGEIEGAAKIAYLLEELPYTTGDREKDFAEAARLYRIAAEAGIAWAMNNLGSAYRDGQGVEEDKAQAVLWYRKSIDSNPNNKWPHGNLGEMHIFGLGVPLDGAMARYHLEKAHELGNEGATANLIMLLSNLPFSDSIVDPQSYNWEGQTEQQRVDARKHDAIRAIAWAQAIGLLTKPVAEDANLEQLLKIVSTLPSPEQALSDTKSRSLILAAQTEAKALLADHIEIMEEKADGGWAWGRIGGNTADLLTSLYSERLDQGLDRADRDLRDRLLVLQARLSAEWNPDWFQTLDVATLKRVQNSLSAVGISIGTVDGRLGPATRRGIREFQSAIGLPVSGEIDPVTGWALIRAADLGMRTR